MADQEQLELLTRSIDEWNTWRRKHPEILPDLHDADLSLANLIGAHLSRANLSETNLFLATLSDAYLAHVTLSRTIFAWVDLNSVDGLETAYHCGPSILDINSITLPLDEPTRQHFLQGIGFTQTQIDYLPSLLTPRPIQYHSLFISYAHQDQTP